MLKRVQHYGGNLALLGIPEILSLLSWQFLEWCKNFVLGKL